MEQNDRGIDYGRVLPGTVIKPLPCGCTVDGWGILSDPWTVILCKRHKSIQLLPAKLQEIKD